VINPLSIVTNGALKPVQNSISYVTLGFLIIEINGAPSIGRLKVYINNQFVSGIMKVWNGNAWQTQNKIFDGNNWIILQ
jgi:hypothetical protein